MTDKDVEHHGAGGVHGKVEHAAEVLEVTEVDQTYEQTKNNRIVNFFYWIGSFVIPGLGMFSEAYWVFAIGNLSPLFKAAYPQCPNVPTDQLPPGFDRASCVCWGKSSTGYCDVAYSVSDTLTYTQVAGIIFGQLVIGFFADRIGRKLGSILTASIMCIFGILLIASSPNDQPNNMFVMFTVMQALFGIGVGGEYPVASTSANERAEQTAHLTQKRGETVVLVFSMQGWGNVINTIVILALLAMYGQYGSKTPLVYGANVVGAGIPNGTISAVLPINSTVAATANTNATSAKLAGSYTLSTSILSNNTATITPPGSTFQIVQGGATASGGGYFYDPRALSAVWRTSYFIGLIPILFMLFWRIYVLRESAVFLAKRASLRELGETQKYNNKKNMLLLKNYWHRVTGCALSWFVWDFAFYGNKLFQSNFINAVIGGAPTLIQTLEWVLLNNSVALVGYYFAAFTVDKPWMGRKWMQIMGFMWMFVLFLPCGIAYYSLTDTSSPGNIHAFQFLYFFSSFWGQFGPNATTWLLPAETVPTETRAMCHGIAAAVGKAGALVAGVIFGLSPTCTAGLSSAMVANGSSGGCLVTASGNPAKQKSLLSQAVNQRNFYISAFCGLAGAIVTFFLIPDVTGLDLKEGDKRWLAILAGDEYDGPAINPKHLSFFERYILRIGRKYNPNSTGAAKPAAIAAMED